jgi:hypothetical protein
MAARRNRRRGQAKGLNSQEQIERDYAFAHRNFAVAAGKPLFVRLLCHGIDNAEFKSWPDGPPLLPCTVKSPSVADGGTSVATASWSAVALYRFLEVSTLVTVFGPWKASNTTPPSPFVFQRARPSRAF